MDSQELARRKSYMNIELCNNFKLAFDIALSKISVDEEEYFKNNMMFLKYSSSSTDIFEEEYFKNNMMFLEATNNKHPKWPNCLFFKDYQTRETIRIGYDLMDCI